MDNERSRIGFHVLRCRALHGDRRVNPLVEFCETDTQNKFSTFRPGPGWARAHSAIRNASQVEAEGGSECGDVR